MPRFVILTHDHPFRHWDLMLEKDCVLRTWRLAAPPGLEVAAEALGDHRLAYLDYEGPVSNDRGQVKRWDAGSMEWIVDDGVWVRARVVGEKLRGELTVGPAGDRRLVCRYLPSDQG